MGIKLCKKFNFPEFMPEEVILALKYTYRIIEKWFLTEFFTHQLLWVEIT